MELDYDMDVNIPLMKRALYRCVCVICLLVVVFFPLGPLPLVARRY